MRGDSQMLGGDHQLIGPRAWTSAASLVTARLGDGKWLCELFPRRRVRHGVQWLSALIDFAGGLGRVGPGRAAVACLRPPRRWTVRLALAHVLVLVVIPVVAVRVLETLWPPLWMLILAPVAAMLAYGARTRRFDHRGRAARELLAQATPPRAWHLYNLAGDPRRPGAGRVLLEQLCAEADDHRRVLYLDTIAPADPELESLVGYYERSRFVVVAEAPVEYGGVPLRKVRMVRHPE